MGAAPSVAVFAADNTQWSSHPAFLTPFTSSSTTFQKHDEHLGEHLLSLHLFSHIPFFPRTCPRGLHILRLHQLFGYIQTKPSSLLGIHTIQTPSRGETARISSPGEPPTLKSCIARACRSSDLSLWFLWRFLSAVFHVPLRPCHVPRVRMMCDSISFLSLLLLPFLLLLHILQRRSPSLILSIL
jgi:hypothetical protein